MPDASPDLTLDTPPRKRRWFQFSLLTLIVVVNLTGLLMGMNVRHVEEKRIKLNHGFNIHFHQGWPFTAYSVSRSPGGGVYRAWYLGGLFANIVLGLFMFGAAASFSELAGRRRISHITLVVLASMIGLLLWMNGRKDTAYTCYGTEYEESKSTQGWPLKAYEEIHHYDVEGLNVHWFAGGLLVNALLVLLISHGAIYGTELLVRRQRKAKRHDE